MESMSSYVFRHLTRKQSLFLGLESFSANCAIAPASVLCTLTRIDDKMSMGVKSSKRCLRRYFRIDQKYGAPLVGFDMSKQ